MGNIASIDRIKKELERGYKKDSEDEQDELAEWVKFEFDYAFNSTQNENVISCFSDIMIWVQSQKQFMPYAKTEFASGADGWLIAYAKVNDCVLVTQEVLRPNVKNKVPIPNVCRAFSVPYIDTFEMIRALGIKWS